MNKCLPMLWLAGIALLSGAAQARSDNWKQAKALEIYAHAVSIRTVKGQGKVPELAAYLAKQLVDGGFDAEDVKIYPYEETAALVARYRGDGSSGRKPLLFLAHMDVVGALKEAWEFPPFELSEKDGYFLGRGSLDNKFGVAMLTTTFLALKRKSFVPDRDLVLAFTGDEESGLNTASMLVTTYRDQVDAEFALNSDIFSGELDETGAPLLYGIQTAEKTYASFRIVARNPGGHSAQPRLDNAIFDIAEAIRAVQQYRFPAKSTEETRAYFRAKARQMSGDLRTAMERFADDPADQWAIDRLFVEPAYVGLTRTTCIPTMLSGGHVANALPRQASVIVNCRLLPGERVEDVLRILEGLVASESVAVRVTGNPTAAPASPLREDVVAAVRAAVADRFGDVEIVGKMSAGATDGLEFRLAGIPTYGTSGIFMKPNEMRAHSVNERLPTENLTGGIDHWEILIRHLAGPGE